MEISMEKESFGNQEYNATKSVLGAKKAWLAKPIRFWISMYS